MVNHKRIKEGLNIKHIVFFDFDGTITKNDSFVVFFKFISKKSFFKILILNLHLLILYKMGICKNPKYKFLSILKGKTKNEIEKLCNEFMPILLSHCKKTALDKIKWHQDNNHRIVLVSASFEEYLSPLCKYLNIDLIATKMEFKDNKITGYIEGKNCKRNQKVIRIKEVINISEYDSIYVYGDSIGDKEMLELATQNQSFYRIFK